MGQYSAAALAEQTRVRELLTQSRVTVHGAHLRLLSLGAVGPTATGGGSGSPDLVVRSIGNAGPGVLQVCRLVADGKNTRLGICHRRPRDPRMLPNPVAMTRNVTSWSGKVPIRSFAEIICVNGDSPDTEIRVEAELFVDRTWKGQDKGAQRAPCAARWKFPKPASQASAQI
jgi:hypothetical protein